MKIYANLLLFLLTIITDAHVIKVLLNCMTKALVHELRESSKVNGSSLQFKSNDSEKLKEQYLEKIERKLDTSKHN